MDVTLYKQQCIIQRETTGNAIDDTKGLIIIAKFIRCTW